LIGVVSATVPRPPADHRAGRGVLEYGQWHSDPERAGIRHLHGHAAASRLYGRQETGRHPTAHVDEDLTTCVGRDGDREVGEVSR
jgi:hypothetical protein